MRDENKIYLTGLNISSGQFSSERSVSGTDYEGRGFSGFFDSEYINRKGLEVSVLDQRGDLVLISPQGGQQFMESRHVTVSRTSLVGL